jgi:hypothetical protein
VAGHPECAARVPAILEALQAGGLTAEARPQQVGDVLSCHMAVACCHAGWLLLLHHEVPQCFHCTRADIVYMVTHESW